VVRRHLGDPRLDERGLDDLRAVIRDSGALDEVERLIARRTEAAVAALQSAPLAQPARDVLSGLAVAATSRRD
jgi:geranylgeranyl diphosphate synthase type I